MPEGTVTLPVVVSIVGVLVWPTTSVVVVPVVIITSLVVGVRFPMRSLSITVLVLVSVTEPDGNVKSVSGVATSGVIFTLITLVLVTVLPWGSFPTKVTVTTLAPHQLIGLTAVKLWVSVAVPQVSVTVAWLSQLLTTVSILVAVQVTVKAVGTVSVTVLLNTIVTTTLSVSQTALKRLTL